MSRRWRAGGLGKPPKHALKEQKVSQNEKKKKKAHSKQIHPKQVDRQIAKQCFVVVLAPHRLSPLGPNLDFNAQIYC